MNKYDLFSYQKIKKNLALLPFNSSYIKPNNHIKNKGNSKKKIKKNPFHKKYEMNYFQAAEESKRTEARIAAMAQEVKLIS